MIKQNELRVIEPLLTKSKVFSGQLIVISPATRLPHFCPKGIIQYPGLIFREIRRDLHEEGKQLAVFVEDVTAASSGLDFDFFQAFEASKALPSCNGG